MAFRHFYSIQMNVCPVSNNDETTFYLSLSLICFLFPNYWQWKASSVCLCCSCSQSGAFLLRVWVSIFPFMKIVHSTRQAPLFRARLQKTLRYAYELVALNRTVARQTTILKITSVSFSKNERKMFYIQRPWSLQEDVICLQR